VNNKHGVHDYQRDSTSPESMQRNQIGGSALTTSQQEQVLQPEQQRVPIEYYQNIKNQLDHVSSSNIQWQDAYKKLHMQWQEAYQKLHESGLELEGNLNEEEALNHNLRTQLQTVTEVNKGWDQAYRTLQSRSNL
tara:strand:- start:332 stop:736 length:405 start_codon:yes stop_codon:yes gene_type:complete